MAVVDSLKESFLNLDYPKQYRLIYDIREARRQPPENRKKFRKNAKGSRGADFGIKKSRKNSKIDPHTLLKTLTPEQKQKLAKELGYE